MTACDVLIVGGGPAGTALALELVRRGSLSVVVVERTSYDLPRIGETLSPGARGLLDHLGVAQAFDAGGHLPAYGTSAAWGGPVLAVRDFVMTPFGAGWHLDRRRFDASLADAAERAGATVWRRSRVGRIAEASTGFAVEVNRAGEVDHVHARFIADATGKVAAVARRLGADRRQLDRQVGVAGTFRFADDPPADLLTLVEACADGWWYTVEVPGRHVVVVLISDADIVRTRGLIQQDVWRAALSRLLHTAARLDGGHLTTPPRIVAAGSGCLLHATGTNWLAVGDAAASHDPLSSSGIVRALDSGVRAGRAIHAALTAGRSTGLVDYDRRHSIGFDQYCDTRSSYYQIERRWPDAPFWYRRHRHVTIDPYGWLHARDSPGDVPRLPADLRHIDPGRLLALAASGRYRAHELLVRYRAQDPHPVRDLDLVMAMQWLVACGALHPVGTAPSTTRERGAATTGPGPGQAGHGQAWYGWW
jgi:flavin-dependent dehydrogenase